MSSPVITRFAPSPTGFLHIGGARTALFNWVYAQHMHGKMLLRIEDTDESRSSTEAEQAILTGLSWLGLNWDGEAISQKSRKERHQEIAHYLVKQGKAYFCYGQNKEQASAPIRIKVPKEGATIIKDLVQGEIHFPNKDLEDFIILRSDGSPTYMHAVVVDDHDMGITHIIRGDDHLTNAAKQTIIYQAMGWNIPHMAHISLIHGEDGAKLSKRHGALGVEWYRSQGYLPAAIKNYLIRLGWSHGNDEIMSMKQIIEWFSLENINKGAARFDLKKLNYFNAHYIKNSANEELYEYLMHELPILDAEHIFTTLSEQIYKDQILRSLSILKQKAKTMQEILSMLAFIVKPPQTKLSEENIDLLKLLLPQLEQCEAWNKENLSEIIKRFLEKHQLKMPLLGKLMRLALAGENSTLGVNDILVILDKKATLQRLYNMLDLR